MDKMRPALLTVICLLALSGCSGAVAKLHGRPEQGLCAVIVGGRFTVPTGETLSGGMSINLDAEDGSTYRIPIIPHKNLLYQIEPGTYRLAPTRGMFGAHQDTIQVKIEGRTYSLPFPRDILRKNALEAKPKKILPIGTFEAELQTALPGQPQIARLRLDDSLTARRKLVQDIIHEMMDPGASPEDQDSAVAWSRALQTTLMELAAETERGSLYKSAP